MVNIPKDLAMPPRSITPVAIGWLPARPRGIAALDTAATVVVPGVTDPTQTVDLTLIDALRRAHQRSAESLRLHFLSHTQTSLTRYRKTFGTGR